MSIEDPRRSTVHLITDALSQISILFQTEIRLVRAEINEKLNRYTSSGILIGAGGIGLLVALIFVLHSIVRWLELAGLPAQWGFLVVGLVVGVVAAVLLARGIKVIKETSIVPEHAIDQARADFTTVKEHIQ